MHFHLPHPRKQRMRIVWIHGKPGAPHIFCGEEDAFPMLASVDATKDPAFLLRPGSTSERAGEYDVRIRGMHDDAADPPGLLQSHVGPSLSSVSGLINSVAHHVAVTDRPGLTGSRPHDTGIGRGNRQRTNGRGGLLVKNRCPTVASIDRFPDSAGCRTRVVRAWIARDPSDGGNAIPDLGTHK